MTATFVLMLTLASAYGGASTQRQSGFNSYQSCVEFGQGWAESQRALHPDSALHWECLPADRQ